MMALESLNCSPSMSTMGTLRQSLENFISDLSSGLTSTVRYGTPRASRYPLTLQQKGHTSYWYSTSSILGSDAGAAGRAAGAASALSASATPAVDAPAAAV